MNLYEYNAISILCSASSGGIEPLFQISYNRTTKSLHGEDRVYKVYADVVAELMEAQGIESEEDLPDYVVTSSDIDYRDRIKIQSTVQKYIDTAISSTINLPEETTVETIADIYYESWKANLKGVTIWRTNCERAGILTLDTPNEKKSHEVKEDVVAKLDNSCPKCGSPLEHVNGCKQCSNSDCHYGACDI